MPRPHSNETVTQSHILHICTSLIEQEKVGAARSGVTSKFIQKNPRNTLIIYVKDATGCIRTSAILSVRYDLLTADLHSATPRNALYDDFLKNVVFNSEQGRTRSKGPQATLFNCKTHKLLFLIRETDRSLSIFYFKLMQA